MQKTLILTEKPSVARDFEKALGKFTHHKTHFENDDYLITWAIGHLLTPYDPEDYDPSLKKWKLETLPIWIEDFKYSSISNTASQLKGILALLKRKDIERIVVATDAGREGELIARLILNEGKSKARSFRFFTSEALTKEVILREMSRLKPLSDFDRLYHAGVLRQKLDWLMGMNLTRAATLKLGDLFSVGRVQTAVLSLIVKRHLERANFVPEEYYELEVLLNPKIANPFSFKVHWFHPKAQENPRRLKTKDIFEKLAIGFERSPDFNVCDVKKEEKTQRPYGVFSLTDLQRRANILYGFPASKTLSLAQDLYEKDKCLSYPRTDSKFLGKSSFGMVKGILESMQKAYPEYFLKFDQKLVHPNHRGVFNDEKLTDHHGLIPLKAYKGAKESDHGKIYHLVLKELIANFSKTHEYTETKIILTHELTKSFFETKGIEVKEIGYKYLENKNLELELKSEETHRLPSLKTGDQAGYIKHEIQEKKTAPPSEYTEASLLYDMTNPARLVDESEMKRIFRGEIGLGTQATRANIIETLLKRGYIKREKKSLVALPKGIELILKMAKMQNARDLTSVKQTAKMELILEDMAQGNDFNEVKKLETEAMSLLKRQLFSSLEEWKAIETIPRKENASGGFKKGKFSKTNSAKPTEALGACPLCKAGEVKEFPKSYSCSRWKEGCKFSVWKVMSHKKISSTQVKKIMARGKSDEISGFKGKNGKTFSAVLVLDKDQKIQFQFS